LVFWSPAWMRT